MKRNILLISIATLVLLVFIGGVIIAQTVLITTVEDAPLKKEPKNFSKTLKTLKLNEKIEIIDDVSDSWYFAKTTDKTEGYIQKSIVGEPGVSTGTSDSSGQGESSTAGARGFTQEVEDGYKTTAPDFNYNAVDKAEQMTNSYVQNPEQNFANFRQIGKLGEYQ